MLAIRQNNSLAHPFSIAHTKSIGIGFARIGFIDSNLIFVEEAIAVGIRFMRIGAVLGFFGVGETVEIGIGSRKLIYCFDKILINAFGIGCRVFRSNKIISWSFRGLIS